MAAIIHASVNEIWTDLSSGVDVIYRTQDKVPPQRYMQLYTYVFNFCTRASADETFVPSSRNTRRNQNAPPLTIGAGGAEFIGSELYDRLKEFITDYAKELLKKCINLKGQGLLETYTNIWKKFQFSSTVANGIFAYLNRHWIKREVDEGKVDIYEVYNLAVVVWNSTIFEQLHNNLTSAILNLIRVERNGECITTSLISGVISSYLELGINDPDVQISSGSCSQNAIRRKLNVYKRHFENVFIEDTRNYYRQESSDFLQRNSVTEYLKKVEKRLGEEQDRCNLYLDSSTRDPLSRVLHDVLIRHHLEIFHSEFETLLYNQKDDDLSRMFALCERVAGGLDQMKAMLEQHIEREGKAAIQKVATSAANDPKQYVSTILAVHSRFSKLVNESFRQNAGFVQAMDKAFTSFINTNAVTLTVKSTSKSPELLARYCDQLLRKSSRNPEEGEIEELLTQVMVVFKYIEDKDVFQKFYSKMLAKRLVAELSASDEAESNMIAKLKQMCGFEYTCKLQRMFTDAGLSKDLSENYKRQVQDVSIDFSIMVVASSVWPFNPTPPFNVPQLLKDAEDSFTKFYTGMHNGRKLSWLYTMCRGELIGCAFQRKYTFVTSTAQIAILMLYNERSEFTVDELASRTEIKREMLIPQLQSIVKVDLLKVKNSNGDLDANVAGETILCVNKEFSNKKLKVDLSKTIMRTETKRESEEVQKNVEDDRKMVVQAAIVRIMKMRKSLKHQQLMAEVLQQVSSRFQPKVTLIKKCIDILIEKEYIKRHDNDRDVYEYLA